MSDAMIEPEETVLPTMAVAAFAFWPTVASKIGGLGGSEPSPDPAYVFHSAYVDVPAGDVDCSLTFDGLTGDLGVITFRINALPVEPGAQATTVTAWTASLTDVAARGGKATANFQALPGMRYAILGHIYDETDMRSEALSITFQTVQRSDAYKEQLERARKSVFGRRLFRRANRMISNESATLADPVSQTCTSAQFGEPSYAAWLKRLDLPFHKHRKQWEFIYILQALERYGMLQEGARGLGFGVGIEPLPAAMAAAGVTVVASDLGADDDRARDWSLSQQHAQTVEQLRNPAVCPDAVFDRNVSFRPVDMNRIESDLRGFDFVWSSCAFEHLGSIAAGLDFVRNSVECLKHGGLAVHTTELNLTSNDKTVDNEGTVLFRRRDIEKLAVDLSSRGHFVAQIKYDLGNTQHDAYVDVPPYSSHNHLKAALGAYVTTSFGIIVRRGDR
jgi:2-polyprenyl-3-methyl-5-hydroxy-6-metoxy-1,4-benzoquinol methylase